MLRCILTTPLQCFSVHTHLPLQSLRQTFKQYSLFIMRASSIAVIASWLLAMEVSGAAIPGWSICGTLFGTKPDIGSWKEPRSHC